MPMERDPSLDALLELDGQVLVIDPETRHWVRFVVRRVPVTEPKPHGLDYSLTLHGPDGERLVGFDNAHPVRTGWGRRAGQGASSTIGTGCERCALTTTGMRRRSWWISGRKLTQCCATKECCHEDIESRDCLLRGHEGAHAGDRPRRAEGGAERTQGLVHLD